MGETISYEHCWVCDGLTGKAGKGEDSLYDPHDSGPYCERCWDVMFPDATRLQIDNDRLRSIALATLRWRKAYLFKSEHPMERCPCLICQGWRETGKALSEAGWKNAPVITALTEGGAR